MEKIRAQECLTAATVAAWGAGMLKRSDAGRIRVEWEKAARGDEKPQMLTPEQGRIMAAAMGIGVRLKKKDA